MKIIDPTFEFVHVLSREDAYRIMATAARNCYRAELNATPKTDEETVEKIMRLGHLSVIEHVTVTVNIICDRGVTHELVRHRLASYSQESTRYCNYGGEKFGRELTFIYPSWTFTPQAMDSKKYAIWEDALRIAEVRYMEMLDAGASPQEARSVLPNSLATKITMTANLREWIHVFRMRCDLPAHPDMRAVMWPILEAMLDQYPSVFQPVYNWLNQRVTKK